MFDNRRNEPQGKRPEIVYSYHLVSTDTAFDNARREITRRQRQHEVVTQDEIDKVSELRSSVAAQFFKAVEDWAENHKHIPFNITKRDEPSISIEVSTSQNGLRQITSDLGDLFLSTRGDAAIFGFGM